MTTVIEKFKIRDDGIKDKNKITPLTSNENNNGLPKLKKSPNLRPS